MTRTPSTARRSSADSRPTSSCRRAGSRWGRTISSGGWRPSSASRRSSGASPSSRESRCRSAYATERSSSGSPGTRSRHSSGRSCSRPALLALQGFPDPTPGFHRGESRRLFAEMSSVTSFSAPDATSTNRCRPRARDRSGVAHDRAAASADALVHVPRGAGEILQAQRSRYLDLRLAVPRPSAEDRRGRCEGARRAVVRRLRHTAHSDRMRGQRAARRRPTTRSRGGRSRAGGSRLSRVPRRRARYPPARARSRGQQQETKHRAEQPG